MPTLLLSSRQTDDTQKLYRACIAEKWEVIRVHNWRVPPLEATDLAIYGEPLFAQHVAQTLGRKLAEPPLISRQNCRPNGVASILKHSQVTQPKFSL